MSQQRSSQGQGTWLDPCVLDDSDDEDEVAVAQAPARAAARAPPPTSAPAPARAPVTAPPPPPAAPTPTVPAQTQAAQSASQTSNTSQKPSTSTPTSEKLKRFLEQSARALRDRGTASQSPLNSVTSSPTRPTWRTDNAAEKEGASESKPNEAVIRTAVPAAKPAPGAKTAQAPASQASPTPSASKAAPAASASTVPKASRELQALQASLAASAKETAPRAAAPAEAPAEATSAKSSVATAPAMAPTVKTSAKASETTLPVKAPVATTAVKTPAATTLANASITTPSVKAPTGVVATTPVKAPAFAPLVQAPLVTTPAKAPVAATPAQAPVSAAPVLAPKAQAHPALAAISRPTASRSTSLPNAAPLATVSATPATRSARTTPKPKSGLSTPTTEPLRHPFLPPLEPTEPLALEDMQREAHRRLFPGAIRCPLEITRERNGEPEQCSSTLATGQILDMHIKKHMDKLRENWPARVGWIDVDGVETMSFRDANGIEKYVVMGRENIERTKCIFDGCEAIFKHGNGRSKHYKNTHLPPYSYDQLRPLNAPLRKVDNNPRVLPPLPTRPIPYSELVTPPVRQAPRGTLPLPPTPNGRGRKVYMISEPPTDDPFVAETRAWMDCSSSDFMHVPVAMLASGEVDTDEPPHSQVQSTTSRRSRRGSPLPSGAGPLAVSMRLPDFIPPQPTAGPMPMGIRKGVTEIHFRHTGPDVILENIRTLAAEVEEKKKAAEAKEKGTLGDSTKANEDKSIVPAPPTTAPPAPVLGKRLRSKTDEATFRAKRERDAKMERAARRYAHAKTGESVGFDYYANQSAAMARLRRLEEEKEKIKAERERAAAPVAGQ